MRKFRTLLCVALATCTGHIFAQDAEWKPQKTVTGYITLEVDYFNNLKHFERECAINVSEAGFLSSYRPTEKMTLKSVIVYRPGYTIEQMLNEANAEYKFADFLNAKGGRFLTPLSPVNTYYYSPVNNTATLPMLIQNHEFFPLNMDGVSLNGKIGENFKISYDAFLGGFRNSLWLQSGSLGLFGNENNYFYNKVYLSDTTKQSANTANSGLHFGKGGHVGFSFKDYVTIGGGIFDSRETMKSETTNDTTDFVTRTIMYVKKRSYGANIRFKFGTFQLLGEYWKTTVSLPFMGSVWKSKYKGTFVEVSNTFFGKLTPYLRLEYHDIPSSSYSPKSTKYYRYTGGIAYKPMFETTIKLEYMYYDYTMYTSTYVFNPSTMALDVVNHKHPYSLGGIVATITYSF